MATLLDGTTANLVDLQENKTVAILIANSVQFIQEFLAVTFHLVCLSRLETTSGDIKNFLVLFLTLVVFTGPYLNLWLLFTEKIFFSTIDWWVWVEFLLAVLIGGAHIAGSATACVIINSWSQTKSTITWNVMSNIKEENNEVSAHFVEEMFAVSSLLIGCVYLLWLKKMRKDKSEAQDETGDDKNKNQGMIKIEIRFYCQLTLLVAAVSQAFPDAYLSPHVACYKLMMQRITWEIFGNRIGGGLVGLLISSAWCLARVNYRNGIQPHLGDHPHKAPAKKNTPMGQRQRMPGFQLVMQGDSYF